MRGTRIEKIRDLEIRKESGQVSDRVSGRQNERSEKDQVDRGS